MGGLLKKLFGFGNPLQKVVQTAPTSASSQGEKQEGFFTQKQQQLLVAQLQKAIMATGLPLPPEGTSLYDIFCENIYNQMSDWNEGHWLGGYPCFTQDDPRFSRSDYAACTNLLFQMDSCGREDAEILWGDTGVGNFLIAPEDLQQLDFSRVLCNWDCL